MRIGAKKIRDWHTGKGWRDIGYHLVINRDGAIEQGRPLEDVGAHARGYNRDSIGICLVGGVDAKGKPANNFTDAQWTALAFALAGCKAVYPSIKKIRGHNEVAAKACPSFNVQAYLKGDDPKVLTA